MFCILQAPNPDCPYLHTGVPESPVSIPVRTPKTPRTPRLQDPSKTPRFYPVVKETKSMDNQVKHKIIIARYIEEKKDVCKFYQQKPHPVSLEP